MQKISFSISFSKKERANYQKLTIEGYTIELPRVHDERLARLNQTRPDETGFLVLQGRLVAFIFLASYNSCHLFIGKRN